MVIFLGGTCNESTWRDELIPMLEGAGIEYFNPVVDDWTPDFIAIENQIKSKQDTIELYVITSQMTGVYSIAEAVQASNKKPEKTVFCVLEQGFDEGQLRSLRGVSDLISGNGATTYDRLSDIVTLLSHSSHIQND